MTKQTGEKTGKKGVMSNNGYDVILGYSENLIALDRPPFLYPTMETRTRVSSAHDFQQSMIAGPYFILLLNGKQILS